MENDFKKGMVFQSYSSFPWLTVRQNIRFGLKFRRDISEQEKERLARQEKDYAKACGQGTRGA